jgi:hypothetical protein
MYGVTTVKAHNEIKERAAILGDVEPICHLNQVYRVPILLLWNHPEECPWERQTSRTTKNPYVQLEILTVVET